MPDQYLRWHIGGGRTAGSGDSLLAVVTVRGDRPAVVPALHSLGNPAQPFRSLKRHKQEPSGSYVSSAWTNQHLDLLNTCATELRQQQLDYGLPAEFVGILRLAGKADVRFLLFDPDAAFLDGLPVFKDVA